MLRYINVRTSVRPSVHPSIHPYIHPYIHVYNYIYIYIYRYIIIYILIYIDIHIWWGDVHLNVQRCFSPRTTASSCSQMAWCFFRHRKSHFSSPFSGMESFEQEIHQCCVGETKVLKSNVGSNKNQIYKACN